ncbi:MAG: sigma-54-dependent Fis family transcriptional regulator, partial [bacterium]
DLRLFYCALKTLPRYDELQILNDFSLAVSSTMEVDKIMAQIINKSIGIIGVMQGTIMLIDKQSKDSLRTLIRSVDDKCGGRLYTLGSHLMGWMIKNRKPLLINDMAKDQRFKQSEIEKEGVYNLLSVPMILRDELIGLINLFNKKRQTLFTDHDKRIMSIVATQVASFLVNAKTFEEVQASKEKFQKQTIRLKKQIGVGYGLDAIIGENAKIREIKKQIKSITKSPSSVLISGETGTGKELIAKVIHNNSDREDMPFVDLNAAAIPENLVESELFGIEEGIATGVKKRIGIFEQAHNGTLFIDEIGEMSLQSQVKILRALEERKIRRVGSQRNIDISIRLIAATNKNLKEESKKGTFRPDLYYRLSVFEINLPPLRERRDDIPLLTEHFTQKFAAQMGREVKGFSREAGEILCNYDWPGNIRELANVVERAVILTKDTIIDMKYLPPDLRGELEPQPVMGVSFEDALNKFKKNLILSSLRESKNNKAQAARLLKISRAYLFRLLKQLELK